MNNVQIKADAVWIEMDSVEKGILEIIARHNIRWLVMGAAADKYYSKYESLIYILSLFNINMNVYWYPAAYTAFSILLVWYSISEFKFSLRLQETSRTKVQESNLCMPKCISFLSYLVCLQGSTHLY